MNFSIFKIFQIFGIVSNWATTALSDGKITLEEAVKLATLIAEILGVKIEIEIPENLLAAGSDYEEPGKTRATTVIPPAEPVPKPVED